MKNYAKFLQLSTGYIPNTIPPQFSDDYKKPIEILGTFDTVCLDGRKNVDSMMIDVENIAKKKLKLPLGYNLYKNNRLVKTVIF